MKIYKHLVFDLDDTLLDTSRLLVPKAAQEACQAMISAGLRCSLAACIEVRQTFLDREPRGNVYHHLVEYFGVQTGIPQEQVIAKGYHAFHNRDIQRPLEVAPEVRLMLPKLRQDYTLYLVTAGHPKTQSQKVSAMNIGDFFKQIFYIDPSAGESKSDAFSELMERYAFSANEVMSIGNRVDTDLAPAKKLGWSTTWVRYGEYKHLLPNMSDEQPDYIINHIGDLMKVCRL